MRIKTIHINSTLSFILLYTVVFSIRFNIFFSISFCRIISVIEQITNTPSTEIKENNTSFPNVNEYAPFTFNTVPHSHFLIVFELAYIQRTPKVLPPTVFITLLCFIFKSLKYIKLQKPIAKARNVLLSLTNLYASCLSSLLPMISVESSFALRQKQQKRQSMYLKKNLTILCFLLLRFLPKIPLMQWVGVKHLMNWKQSWCVTMTIISRFFLT